jgi:hypothetical protein
VRRREQIRRGARASGAERWRRRRHPGKRGRGRPPKAAKADDANNPPSTDGANAGATDPRQMRIDDASQPSDGSETPAAETPAAAEPASAEQPQSTDAGVDLY